jgi:protein-tyrosine-phosphatase
MAAGFFNQLADPTRARPISAGMQPADRIHPVVIEAMQEGGVDLSRSPLEVFHNSAEPRNVP